MVVIIMVIVGIGLILLNKITQKDIKSFGVLMILLAILVELFGSLNYEEFRSQYEEWIFKEETELVSLSNTQVVEGFFVNRSSENVYTYRYEINSDFGTETSKEYVIDTVCGNVEEIEDPKCETPLLKEYKSKFGVNFWRIMFPKEATKYVFYVPEGTIQKDIKLS